jgi:hypothetical protein
MCNGLRLNQGVLRLRWALVVLLLGMRFLCMKEQSLGMKWAKQNSWSSQSMRLRVGLLVAWLGNYAGSYRGGDDVPHLNPAVSLANEINGKAATLGVDLFVGLVRPVSDTVPAQAVFVRGSDGLPANRFFCDTDSEVRHPTVQIRIRSPNYLDGYELAKEVYEICQSSQPLNVLDVVARQSEPIYLEQDENKNHQWSLNFDLMYQV